MKHQLILSSDVVELRIHHSILFGLYSWTNSYYKYRNSYDVNWYDSNNKQVNESKWHFLDRIVEEEYLLKNPELPVYEPTDPVVV